MTVFEKLMADIHEMITYLNRYCKNAYVKNECRIITEALVDIENKKFTKEESVKTICDTIERDINKMKRVPDLSDKMYAKMDELSVAVAEIVDAYFRK